MSETDIRKYYFPGTLESPNGPYALQRLAEDVEADMEAEAAKLATLQAAVAKLPRGIQGDTLNTAESTNLGGSSTPVVEFVVNVVAGRKYRARFQCSARSSGAALALVAQIKTSASGDATANGTVLGAASIQTPASVNTWGHLPPLEASFSVSTSGQLRLKAVLTRATGTVGYDVANRSLTLHDEGAA